MDDGLLHPLGRVASGEIPAQGVASQGDSLLFAFLFLPQNSPHHVGGQAPLLAELLQALGLGEGWRGLFAGHHIQELFLFLSREEGQLIGRIQGDFLLVHHIQQGGDQLGEADVTHNLNTAAFTGIFCHTVTST